MPIHPRRVGLVLLGSIAGTCLGLVAILGLRACSRAVSAYVAAFESLRARAAAYLERCER